MKKILGLIAVLALVAGTCQAVDYANHMYQQRVYRVALGSGNAPSAADMVTIGVHNGDMVLNTDDNVLYIMHATNVYTKFTAAGAGNIIADTITIGGIANGAQAEALGTNEVGTVAVENSQVNITGPTNADTAVITLTAPTSAQLGQSVVIYNAGTNTLSIVYTAGSTNDVAATNLMLVHASSTNGWSYLEIPALDSELTKLALKDGGSLTNLSAASLVAGTVATAVDGNAITNLDAANIAEGSVLSAVDGNAVTNLAPATAFPGYAVCVVTNLDGDGTTNIITFIGTKSVLGE